MRLSARAPQRHSQGTLRVSTEGGQDWQPDHPRTRSPPQDSGEDHARAMEQILVASLSSPGPWKSAVFSGSPPRSSHTSSLPVSGPEHSLEMSTRCELLGTRRIRGLEGFSDRQEMGIKRENNAESGASRHGFPGWLCSLAAAKAGHTASAAEPQHAPL